MTAEISSASFSETDASNNSTPPDGWPESQAPSTVNDCARMMMGAIKRFWGRVNPSYASTGGPVNYVLTPSVALGAYVTGEVYSFRANATNTTAAPTLNISGLGGKLIKKFNGGVKIAVAAGDIGNGQPVQCSYDGTDMVLMGATNPTVAFSAHKNGVDQTGIGNGGYSIVTFGTEVFDVNAHFAANAWTPPARKVLITACIFLLGTNVVDGQASTVAVFKNGATFKQFSVTQGATIINSHAVTIIDDANGTDVYDVRVFPGTSGGAKTVDGSSTNTYFMGHTL